MRPLIGFTLLMTAAAVIGCGPSRQVVKEKSIPDPLLVSKKHVEGKQSAIDTHVPSGDGIPPAPELPAESGITTPVQLLPRR